MGDINDQPSNMGGLLFDEHSPASNFILSRCAQWVAGRREVRHSCGLWGVLHAPGRARHMELPSPMNHGRHWRKPSVLLIWNQVCNMNQTRLGGLRGFSPSKTPLLKNGYALFKTVILNQVSLSGAKILSKSYVERPAIWVWCLHPILGALIPDQLLLEPKTLRCKT